VLNILGYFSSLDFYLIILFLIILGAITQSAIGIGFGIPAGILVLLEPSMVPSCIILMGSFLALSNAMLSYKDIIKVDLIYSFTGRVIGSILAMPLIFLTLGTDYYLIVFGVLLLIATYLSAKKWNIVATKKNITIAGTASGIMGTLTGIGGPPMAIVYQNSSAPKVVATLNMFFGIGALFSVLLFVYFDLINLPEVMKSIYLSPGLVIGTYIGRRGIVRKFVNRNLKNLIIAVCFISALVIILDAILSL
jgi:uncharacterized membrane protein YfcA|tara:strand:+ start:836 stop:1585 length:750 start_codon:yes stop_codon:yes gene_type:complete